MFVCRPCLIAEGAMLIHAEGHPRVRGEADRPAAQDGNWRHQRHPDRPHYRLVRHLIEFCFGKPRHRLMIGRNHSGKSIVVSDISSAEAHSLATASGCSAQSSHLDPLFSFMPANVFPSLRTVARGARDSAADVHTWSESHCWFRGGGTTRSHVAGT